MFTKYKNRSVYQEQQNDEGGDGNGAPPAPPAPPAEPAGDPAPRKLSDQEAQLLKENMKRKEALDGLKTELKLKDEALEKLKGFEKLLDANAKPEELLKMLQDQKTAEDRQLEAKGEWDRLKTRMAEEHSKQIIILQSELDNTKKQLGEKDGIMNELTIGSNFSQSKFISDEMTLTPAKARVVYGNHFDLVDGKVVGYDKPRGEQSRTPIADQYGNSVDFESALKQIIQADPEREHMLKSKAKPGAGSDSKKPNQSQQIQNADKDGLSKISSGLKSLNF